MTLGLQSTLVVGDIHATADELDDCQNLIEGIIELRQKHGYKVVIFLGDQFHTHSLLPLQVVDFWRRAVARLRVAGYQQIYLRGNHDMAANGEGPNALEVFRELLAPEDLIVTDANTVDGILFVAHQVEKKSFAEIVNDKNVRDFKLLVCHQTFDGAEYENGFFAADGIDQNLAPMSEIVSGHIHKTSRFGKVHYPGSPRWRSSADANEFKALVGYQKGMLGGPYVLHPTAAYCRPIESLNDTPEIPYEAARRWKDSKLTVTVKGPAEHVKTRAAALEAQGVAVHRRPDLRASVKVSESRPVAASMVEFMKTFAAPGGTAGARLAELATQRIS